MKKTILLLTLLFAHYLTFAQADAVSANTENNEQGQYDTNGKKTGEWKSYHYENGKLKEIGN